MQPIKLFFDECCSPRLPRKLKEVYEEDFPGIETIHLSEMFLKGTNDADWIPILEEKTDWIVITCDKGRDPKKPKLPILCTQIGVTFISMTPRLQEAGYSAHKQAMLSIWPSIRKIQCLQRGTKVSLGIRQVNKGHTTIPWLSIDQIALDIWCHENNIEIPN